MKAAWTAGAGRGSPGGPVGSQAGAGSPGRPHTYWMISGGETKSRMSPVLVGLGSDSSRYRQ